MGPRGAPGVSPAQGDGTRPLRPPLANTGPGRQAAPDCPAASEGGAQPEGAVGPGAGGFDPRAAMARCRAGWPGRQAHRVPRAPGHHHRRARPGGDARWPDLDPACSALAAVGGDCCSAWSGGERCHLRPHRHRAHPPRRGPSALRARAAADRVQPLDAGEDHLRVHRGPQHHAGRGHARLRPGSAATAERGHRPVHPLPRPGDRPLVARRDEPHDPPAVGGRLRLRSAARLRVRQRADGHGHSPVGDPRGPGAVQRRGGDRPARLRLPGPRLERAFRNWRSTGRAWSRRLPATPSVRSARSGRSSGRSP